MASLLERTPDVQLVGQAATGEAALRLVAELLPDIVLMDLQMPGMGGIAATRAIAAAHPAIGVIVLTMFEDDESVFAAMRAGARGYVLKDADRGALLRATRAVAQGDVLLGQGVARKALQLFASQPIGPGTRPQALADLTAREVEIVRLIARGARNAEIAAQLVISETTVTNHVFEHLHQAPGHRPG